MKTYIGTRRMRHDARSGILVVVSDPKQPANINWVLQNVLEGMPAIMDIGFEWGYAGGGPHSLALSILTDHFGEDPADVLETSKHGYMPAICNECEGEGFIRDWIGSPGYEIWPGCRACDGKGHVEPKESLAFLWSHPFMLEFVARFPHPGFLVTQVEIAAFVEKMNAMERAPK